MNEIWADAMLGDQADVISFLASPDAYGQSAPVERIDTHCSIVFLARDRAYKLKRAVTYSYLDYSTAALRRQACEMEVALNRRTAPQLYIGTSAITRRANRELGIDGDGIPVDWVVVMARFDQESLFDRMAESGRLTTKLMRELADAIFDFHRSAEVRRDYGGASALADIIRQNDENLRIASPPLDQRVIAELRAESETALSKQADLLDHRRSGGKVRRCHGDLHLRNICLVDERPTLFDCIEFSDALACIDMLYDLAFLLMDLHYRGHDDLGSTVFNRYLDLSGDREGVSALPLLLSLRAAIRAHVTVASAPRQSSAIAARRQLEQAQEYLTLARQFLVPANPSLLAVGGYSGSGKSTLAYGIADHFRPVPGARVIRSDVIRKRLMGEAPEQRLPLSAYREEISRAVYAGMFQEAAETLEAGYTAIIDATFLDEADRKAAEMLPRPQGVAFVGLWLDARPEILRQRISARIGDASDADLDVLARQLRLDPGPIIWRRIDVSGDYGGSLDKIRRALSESIQC